MTLNITTAAKASPQDHRSEIRTAKKDYREKLAAFMEKLDTEDWKKTAEQFAKVGQTTEEYIANIRPDPLNDEPVMFPFCVKAELKKL